MILPINFLWQQLNGPQITAISQAIYEYWKQMFDNRLDYLNNLTVDTATDSHLNLFGIIANFVRPVIQVADKDFFLFTEHPEHDNDKGFSSLGARSIGGRFVGMAGATTGARALDTEFYRLLLKTFSQSEGEIDSLVLLDDLCHALSVKDGSAGTSSYEFSFVEDVEQGTGRGPGDLYIDIGSVADWINPLQIYAILTGLSKSVFWPLPRIWTSLDTDVRCHTPTVDIPGGTYSEPVTIELSCDTPSATIFYTLDGTEPTRESGTPFSAPIQITGTTTVMAKAWALNREPSNILTVSYIIE